MPNLVIKPGGGGVTNTGDAAVSDVAQGKTFSSASLTNATGMNTKNATVPSEAPIQPAQAFVDNIVKFRFYDNISNTGVQASVVISDDSIRFFDPTLLAQWASFAANNLGVPHFTLSGKGQLTNTNEILSAFATDVDNLTGAGGGTLNLSGGTNAAPSGQGLIDKATLEANGWTVLTN